MSVFRMAWRNIWRNRRRTWVTVGAMTLALLAMVLYTGLMEGYLHDMERNILDVEIGDLQIFAEGYRDRPSIYTLIEEPAALLARLDELGYAASARLLGGGLVAAGESSAGASLRGVELERDAQASQVNRHVASGGWLDAADPMGVVMGRRLARTLGVQPGDELVILSQASDGSMANDLFAVRGVLHGISDSTDRAGVFMMAQTLRDFLVLPDGAHQLIVRRPAATDLPQAAEAVRALAPRLDVRTWRQLMPTLASFMDSARVAMQTVFFIVYLVVGILILNAMLMAVFERIRELGLLKALGVEPRRILSLILAESAFQTGLAVLSGLALSLPALWYLTQVGIDTGSLAGTSMMGIAFTAVLRAIITPFTFVGPVLILIAIVSVAVLYPAIKAARISPVEAMRYQ